MSNIPIMIFAFHAAMLNCFSIYLGVKLMTLLSPRILIHVASRTGRHRGTLNTFAMFFKNSEKWKVLHVL